jgi:hypothetical protein
MISHDALSGILGIAFITAAVVLAFFVFACVSWTIEVLYALIKSWWDHRP